MSSADFSVYNYFKNEDNTSCSSKFLLLKAERSFKNELYLGYFFDRHLCNNMGFLKSDQFYLMIRKTRR